MFPLACGCYVSLYSLGLFLHLMELIVVGLGLYWILKLFGIISPPNEASSCLVGLGWVYSDCGIVSSFI